VLVRVPRRAFGWLVKEGRELTWEYATPGAAARRAIAAVGGTHPAGAGAGSTDEDDVEL
jgi:hypothetical protein